MAQWTFPLAARRVPTPGDKDEGGDRMVAPANTSVTDTKLNTSQIILILTTTLWSRHYYYSHFTDEGTIPRSLRKMIYHLPYLDQWRLSEPQACWRKQLIGSLVTGSCQLRGEHRGLSWQVWTPCAAMWVLTSSPGTFSLIPSLGGKRMAVSCGAELFQYLHNQEHV